MEKKLKFLNNNILEVVKIVSITFLLFLVPLTLFLMAYGWYDSIEVQIYHSRDIVNQTGFFHSALLFGAIGLVSSLFILLLFLMLDFYLISMIAIWQKIIFIITIAIYSGLFLTFETISIVLLNYYFTVPLLLFLIIWPFIYICLLLINSLTQYKVYKNKSVIKIRQVHHHNYNIDKDSEVDIYW